MAISSSSSKRFHKVPHLTFISLISQGDVDRMRDPVAREGSPREFESRPGYHFF
jgi:hypothetical protein